MAPKKLPLAGGGGESVTPAAIPTRWLFPALLCLVAWGVFGFISKLNAGQLSAVEMQVLFTVGTLPLIVPAFWRSRGNVRIHAVGSSFGMLTGVVAAFANLFLFSALKRGPASIVVPITALYPMVSFLLATAFLKERMNQYQYVGIVLALIAISIFSL